MSLLRFRDFRPDSVKFTTGSILTTTAFAALVFFASLLSAFQSMAISPVLSAIEAGAASYTEGAAATSVTATLNAVDVDSNISGATVWISANFISTEDVLSFTPSGGVTGTYDASTGILTLLGSATATTYKTVLRTVKYINSNIDNPSNLARTISFIASDGTDSNTQSRTMNVVPVNDAPVVFNLEATAITFTEGDAAITITSALTIADVDNTMLTGGTITVSNYTTGQDVVAFTNVSGIAGAAVVVSAGTATLALTGSATLADYQAALQTVTYQNINTNNPIATNHVVTFRVNDGSAQSSPVTRTVTVAPVNDAPLLSGIESANFTYTENDGLKSLTGSIAATDVDNANLSGAIVQITANLSIDDVLSFVTASGITGVYDGAGTLTLTGSSSVANYVTALKNVKFKNASDDPSTLQRTVSFTVRDATDNSNTLTRNITFVAVNDKPVLSALEAASLAYTEDDPATFVTTTIVVSDIDNTNLASATVSFSATGYTSPQDVLTFTDGGGITSLWNSVSRTLTLTGSASVATYQAALRSVSYINTNTFNPTTANRTLNFTVNDGALSSTTITRTITFTAVNDAPVLASGATTHLDYYEAQAATSIAPSFTVADDNANLTGATFQLTSNYLQSEDLLTWANSGGVTGTLDATTGTITFTGSATVGSYQSVFRSIKYRNSNTTNPSSLTRTASFTTTDATYSSNTVTRDIAVLVTDKITTQEEVAIDIDVLANDNDLYAAIDPTTVTVTVAPLNGTTIVDATTGVITYTPNAEFSGTNTFKYTVKDINGAISLQKNVLVTVTLINDAPSFTPGSDIVVNEDAGTQTFAAWATSMNDGDPFTAQTLTFVVTNDKNSLFASQPAINGTTGNLTFKSNNNSNGIATVTVYLKDNGLTTPLPNVNVSPSITFTISVLTVNDPPVGNPEFFSTSSNTPLTANAKANDTDPEGDATTLSPTPLVPPANGSVVIGANGTFTYTPNSGFTGIETFTYQICDNGTDNGIPASRCGQSIVSITVNPPNSDWNIVGNNSVEFAPNSFMLTPDMTTQQGAIWNRNPLDLRYSFNLRLSAIFSAPGVVHDDGADGIVFVFQRDTTPPPLDVPDLPIYARGQTGGSLGIGGISPSFAVEVDTYQNAGEIADDHIALDIDGQVYSPLAGPVPALVDASNVGLNIEDGVWHDIDIKWDNPSNTLKVLFDGQQRIINTQDIATLVFGSNPKGVYWGFSSSTGGKTNYQAVKDIVMSVINLPPVAGTDANTLAEDTSVSGLLTGNDYDPEGGLIHVQPETKGTAHGQVVINANGTYAYTPNPDYNGSDTFTYQVCDEFSPSGCSTGTVNINVTPVQDAPIALPDEFSTTEDAQLVVTCNCVLINDSDVDGEALTTIADSDVSHGTLDFHSDGTFTYLPNPDYFGDDTFTYHNTDGIDNSATVIVVIHVLPVNDAPVAVDDALNVTEDTPTLLPILSNDIDVDDQLTPSMVTIVTPPTHGIITLNSSGVLYTPGQDYNGPDTFTYSLTDPAGATSGIAQVSITVQPVNDVPVTLADDATTVEDHAVTISVLSNDTDVDNAIVPNTVKVVNGPSHGSTQVNADGTITYTPDQDYFGIDSFDYTVKDTEGGVSVPATVSITVTPENDAPVALGDAATTLQNTPVNVNVTSNDIDVDNTIDASSVTVINTPVHGSVVNSGGVITYTPAPDFLGDDSFTYTIEDAGGLVSAPAKVVITVVPPNQPPNAVNDGPVSHRFLLDLSIDVLANDFDVDNAHDELTLVSFTQPNIGTVEFKNGVMVYHPAGTESATVTFTYMIRDPAGLTDEATVTIQYVYNPLTVSEGFSPNNDGSNDTWYILSIENYPNNNVKIFDRWGLLVFQKDHYENSTLPWDGRANTGQQSGKLLDQGTYYYMLDVGGEIKMLSGFVMIVR
ncbi:MAG: Ig-like domain-containing protein [Chryseolinea sp.]